MQDDTDPLLSPRHYDTKVANLLTTGTSNQAGTSTTSAWCTTQGHIELTCLDSRDLPWRRDLVRSHIFRLRSQQQVIILIVRLDSSSYCLENLGGDRRLVVGIVVLRDKFLDLRRGQDPADVKENLDIGQVCLKVSNHRGCPAQAPGLPS